MSLLTSHPPRISVSLLTHRHVAQCISCPYASLLSFCVCAGFDLCEVGQEEVVLKTGKLANRRTLHFALQSLLALFGKYAYSLVFILSF